MGTVRVTAEWALWGKTQRDPGYRLLECSKGTLSAENFDEVLNRYSPGTLDRLPQVTVSWFPSDEGQQQYLAVAIHDQSESNRLDVSGREIVRTRYFCVPYTELAGGPVSYQAMYKRFSEYQLPMPDGARIETELEVLAPERIEIDRLAIWVAALLLTGRPVCVVGADGVGLGERLAFLDMVMSFLPYGMRSRLSASTWASSTFQEHKLRLFFARSPRRDDLVVTWGQQDYQPVAHERAAEYLRWLEYDAGQPETLKRLADIKDQLGFTSKDVLTALELTRDRPDPGQYATGEALPVTAVTRTETPRPVDPAGVEGLIVACTQDLHFRYERRLASHLDELRNRLDGPITIEERRRCRSIIVENRLLQIKSQVKAELHDSLIDVLLRIAFDRPLTYPDYLWIEDWSGRPAGESLPWPVLHAMSGVGFGDVATLLLVLKASGDKQLEQMLKKTPLNVAVLIAAVTDPSLQPAHARTVCHLAISELAERAKRLDQYAVCSALRRHGYLATVLQERYSDALTEQVDLLDCLLRIAHGRTLDTATVRDIFGNTGYVPTTALFVAVLAMVHREDTEFVRQEFYRSLLARVRYGDKVIERLSILAGAADDPRLDGPESVSLWRKLRH